VLRWYERTEQREGGTTRDAWEALLERQKNEKAEQLDVELAEQEALEEDIRREAENPSEFYQNALTLSPFQGQELRVIVKARERSISFKCKLIRRAICRLQTISLNLENNTTVHGI
jgi:hypothetical protein